MGEFLIEANVLPRIEYTANPIYNKHVPVGLTKVWMIGQPDIEPVSYSNIDRDKLCSQHESVIWQNANPSSSLNRVEDC
jgi:hypothetical protein